MWEDKLKTNKTWANFNNHFHEAQLNLKKIRGLTIIQAGYHHANMLASQINENLTIQLTIRDSEVLALMQNIPVLVSSSSESSASD